MGHEPSKKTANLSGSANFEPFCFIYFNYTQSNAVQMSAVDGSIPEQKIFFREIAFIQTVCPHVSGAQIQDDNMYIKKILLIVLLASASIGALGCASRPPIPAEALSSDTLIIENDLLGPSEARGFFKSIAGDDRGFTAYINGRMEGETFFLEERFEYDDGERDEKTWRLTKKNDGTYVGLREDVVGEALGYMDGPAFRLEYKVDLPKENGGFTRVGFRDVLVKLENGEIFNKATVGWRGIRAGRVELTITPVR